MSAAQQGTKKQTASSKARRLWKRQGPEFLTLYSFRSPTDGSTEPDDLPETNRARLEPATTELLDSFRSTYPRQMSERKYAILADRINSSTEQCWFIVTPSGVLSGYCHATRSDNLNARINHRVRVAGHQAYFFDDYVCRQHRRQGYHRFAITERLRLLAAEGVQEGLTTISNGNTASLASYRDFALAPVARLVYIPLLKRTFQRRAR